MLIDFWIFGSGRGLGAPTCDQTFYWLNGRFYTWIGGFGAQLQSIEWRCPRPGDRRVLSGTVFRPFSADRKWGKWRVSWVVDGPQLSLEAIREMRKHLGG